MALIAARMLLDVQCTRLGGAHVRQCRCLTSGGAEAGFPRDQAGVRGYLVVCGGAGRGPLDVGLRGGGGPG